MNCVQTRMEGGTLVTPETSKNAGGSVPLRVMCAFVGFICSA